MRPWLQGYWSLSHCKGGVHKLQVHCWATQWRIYSCQIASCACIWTNGELGRMLESSIQTDPEFKLSQMSDWFRNIHTLLFTYIVYEAHAMLRVLKIKRELAVYNLVHCLVGCLIDIFRYCGQHPSKHQTKILYTFGQKVVHFFNSSPTSRKLGANFRLQT